MKHLYDFDVLNGADELILCGVDEAGRGPLCGPVCCAAVVLDNNLPICVDDSKKLSEKKREALYEEIVRTAVAFNIVLIDNKVIDEINILAATMLGMKRAVEGLSVTPQKCLIDGNRVPMLDIESESVIKGDAKSASIAAASILAKVTRDRWMYEIHEKYPMYGYDKHKGYGTKMHYEMMRLHGVTEIYRKSFLKKFSL